MRKWYDYFLWRLSGQWTQFILYMTETKCQRKCHLTDICLFGLHSGVRVGLVSPPFVPKSLNSQSCKWCKLDSLLKGQCYKKTDLTGATTSIGILYYLFNGFTLHLFSTKHRSSEDCRFTERYFLSIVFFFVFF